MILAQNLRKRYGRTQALDGLSLSVEQGAIYGFIGQNGAGKTTTMRILATLMLPDEGTAQVAGVDVIQHPGEVRRIVGYMPDFFGVYDDLTVGEYLEFYASLSGIKGEKARRLRDDLLELVDLGSRREEFVEGLSRGMQQRLCLARTLIHDPQVLLLDEPASGLDPVARSEMRDLLKELTRMGKTILISSHILSELADLCTHVGMVAAGRLVRQGRVAEVLWASEHPLWRMRVLREPEAAARVLEEVPGVGEVQVTAEGITFSCDGGAEGAADALEAVVRAGHKVTRLAEVETNLEETFVKLAREEVAR
ncbi:MAG: ABC transporter ATP-binding protein [Bacillota bacterium]